MRLLTGKPIFGISGQVTHKSDCSEKLEIRNFRFRKNMYYTILLARQQTLKVHVCRLISTFVVHLCLNKMSLVLRKPVFGVTDQV